MSATLIKSYGFSSAVKVETEDLVGKKQGIVSILGSDTERPSKPASLRRTLSADMSSKKWLSQNEVFKMKKIASSKEFPVEIIDSLSSEEEEENENKKDGSNPDRCDMWNLIISQKAKEDNSESVPPPYIHPLVKRSSSLSKKSLEICTESLGSETGSDGFSSYPASETGDADDDRDCSKQGQSLSFDEEETRFVKNNYVNGGRRSGQPQSFPPPLPSLALNDGASVRMKTHRDNGRLVMEAVAVPSQNNFRAQRHGGRLVLTFANPLASLDDETDEKNEESEEEDKKASIEEMGSEFDSFENDEHEETESEEQFEIEEEEEEEDSNFVNKLPPLFKYKPKPKRSTITFTNRSQTWPNRLNKIVKLEHKQDDEKPSAEPMIPPLAQSLPPRPKPARMIPAPPSTTLAAAAAGSYNAYEYYWRPKPIEKSSGLNCDEQQPQSLKSSDSNLGLSKCPVGNLRGQQKGDNLVVPLLNSCKEPRRSLLFWEPHCIATS